MKLLLYILIQSLFLDFFKFFNNYLPYIIQYFGLWGLISYILQGIFSGMIINLFINNKILVFICYISCLISHCFSKKVYTFCFIYSLDYFFNLFIFYHDNYSFKKVLVLSSINSFISSMTHHYLLGALYNSYFFLFKILFIW